MTTKADRVTRTDVREFFENDPKMIEKWVDIDKDEWAEMGSLHISGLSRERDNGLTFGENVAELPTPELLHLRYELIDHFVPNYDRRYESDPAENGTIEELVITLLGIVETEIGGRWVR